MHDTLHIPVRALGQATIALAKGAGWVTHCASVGNSSDALGLGGQQVKQYMETSAAGPPWGQHADIKHLGFQSRGLVSVRVGLREDLPQVSLNEHCL